MRIMMLHLQHRVTKLFRHHSRIVSLGKMTDFIKKGDDPNTAWEKAKGQYGRVADAVKIIDPRKE